MKKIYKSSLILSFAIVLTLVISSCTASSARALAKEACQYVYQSNHYYELAQKASSGNAKAFYLNKSLSLLRTALPYAAQAGSEDPDLQALGANLSESSRVPVANMLPSLLKQCYMIVNG
jgi:hypothetical protein